MNRFVATTEEFEIHPKASKKVEKAWQLKSGKWHDYNESGKIVEDGIKERDLLSRRKK